MKASSFQKFAKLTYIVIPSILAALTACSSNAPYQTLDYRGTGKARALEIPPDLIASKRVTAPHNTAQKPVLFNELEKQRVAKEFIGVAIATSATIHHDGVFRYLETEGSLEKVWKQFEDFLHSNGLLIAQKNAALGIMSTQWQENRARIESNWLTDTISSILPKMVSSGEKDKFQAIIEPHQGKIRVYIAHYGIVESSADKGDTFRWFYRPSEPLLELEILKRFALYLGIKNPTVKNTDQTPQKTRASLSANNTLIIDEPLDGAWEHLLQALPRRGFILERLDRMQRTIFVKQMATLDWAPTETDQTAENTLERYRVDVHETEKEQTTTIATFTRISQHLRKDEAHKTLREALTNVVAMLNL